MIIQEITVFVCFGFKNHVNKKDLPIAQYRASKTLKL